MRVIKFYRTEFGNCPVEDFLKDIPDKQSKKTNKVPKQEIETAEERKRDYYRRKGQ